MLRPEIITKKNLKAVWYLLISLLAHVKMLNEIGSWYAIKFILSNEDFLLQILKTQGLAIVEQIDILNFALREESRFLKLVPHLLKLIEFRNELQERESSQKVGLAKWYETLEEYYESSKGSPLPPGRGPG